MLQGANNMIIIKRNVLFAFAFSAIALSLSACAPLKSVFNLANKTSPAEAQNHPSSALIYHACHQRWLRNGYDSYSFTVETGEYDKNIELQLGNFTTVDVVNTRVANAKACELVYNGSDAICKKRNGKQLKGTATIADYFRRWERNPALYQSCHPILGYPMGFGNTYGSGGHRIDSERWVMISSVAPLQASQAQKYTNKMSVDELASGFHLAPQVESFEQIKANSSAYTGKYAPLTDLDVKLVSSRVLHEKGRRYVSSELEVANATNQPAKILIKGWMLDRQYKRHPLFVEGENKTSQETVEVEIPSHTSMSISYLAEGAPNFTLGKRSIGILELSSAGGLKMNLTLSNQ